MGRQVGEMIGVTQKAWNKFKARQAKGKISHSTRLRVSSPGLT